jgi:hypothetical protein
VSVQRSLSVRACPLRVYRRSLETVHTLCTWMWLYHLTVTNFGNAAAMNELPMVFNLTIPLQTLASSIVQARGAFCFFTMITCKIIRDSSRIVFTS